MNVILPSGDPEFMPRFHNGDEHIFAQLHKEYQVRLVYYVTRISLSQEEAEDVVAETFIKLWQSRSGLSSPAHIRNFLYVTARNTAINTLVQKKQQSSLLEKYQDMQTAFSNEAIETEMLHLLYTASEQLPAECRKVFQLYLADHKPEEIAARLSITPATVRSQKRRAINLLKEWLQKNWPGLLLLLFFK